MLALLRATSAFIIHSKAQNQAPYAVASRITVTSWPRYRFRVALAPACDVIFRMQSIGPVYSRAAPCGWVCNRIRMCSMGPDTAELAIPAKAPDA